MSDIQQVSSATTSHPALTEADLKHHSQELGLVGKLFGSKEQAPINIAGIMLILCFIALATSPMLPDHQGFTVADQQKLIGSIMLATLAFLGGYLGGRGRG